MVNLTAEVAKILDWGRVFLGGEANAWNEPSAGDFSLIIMKSNI